MYRLLIVDDEKIEREGMAEFIAWEQHDIEIVGTAWNGQDGYEKVEKLKPDIVLTDIKMPVLDGIGLIKKLKEEFPDIAVVVLSGYGEYEYTSRAMELGIKYYILKPCDEERVLPVFEKVKAEIEKKRGEKALYNQTMKKLLPLAKEQMFRNLLLNRETSQKEYDGFLEEAGGQLEKGVCLLAFRNPGRRFDALEQFVMENVLSELYGGEEVFLATSVSEDILFLLKERNLEKIKECVNRICSEFARISPQQIRTALSDRGAFEKISVLYTQIIELFRIGEISGRTDLLCSEMFSRYEGNTSEIFRYKKIRETVDYAGILFEVYLAFLKMELRGMDAGQIREVLSLALQVCREETKKTVEADWENVSDKNMERICMMADLLAELKGFDKASGKEELRMKRILQAVYENLRNPDISIRYLAKEILFMNEEHFGRVFVRSWNMKFSSWLRYVRIELAKGLLDYDPEIKVSRLAELTGYSADGQYFSKAFRKETGMTPTEYCEQIRQERLR